MKTRSAFMALCAASIVAATAAFSQTATLTTPAEALSPAGGVVTVTAKAVYQGQPAALGWAIELPAGWSLDAVRGPNLPSLAPDPGATGTLEFAYVAVPPDSTSFSALLRYPPKAAHATLHGRVLIRQAGVPTTLEAKPLDFSRAVPPTTKAQR